MKDTIRFIAIFIISFIFFFILLNMWGV